MIKWFIILYVIVGILTAVFQMTEDEIEKYDVNFVDILFGVVAVASFWPLVFLSSIVDDIREWYDTF